MAERAKIIAKVHVRSKLGAYCERAKKKIFFGGGVSF
jgi:hypothetical protein